MNKIHKGFGFGLDAICWDKIVIAKNIRTYIGSKFIDSIFYYSTLRGFLNE